MGSVGLAWLLAVPACWLYYRTVKWMHARGWYKPTSHGRGCGCCRHRHYRWWL